MTGKELINKDVEKFKASKRKEIAKKMSHNDSERKVNFKPGSKQDLNNYLKYAKVK